MINKKLRNIVQEKSKEIGHCVCSTKFSCPCNYFKKNDICKCANEEVDVDEWLKENI